MQSVLTRLTAREISTLTRYYDRVIQWGRLPHDEGHLLDAIEAPDKLSLSEGEALPDLTHESERRTAVLLNGAFNHSHDIEGMLTALKPQLARSSRVVVVAYNPYLGWAYSLSNRVGLRKGPLPQTMVTETQLRSLCRLSGYEVVRMRSVGVGGWGRPSMVIVLRPTDRPGPDTQPGLSIVVPARNERGNIEPAVQRLRYLEDQGIPHELIFVEGHSSDGTLDEIHRVARAYQDRVRIKVLEQPGKGKNDAVRVGFAAAEQPLLTILDADLTMPPEMLLRFYDAYVSGLGDFINGNRLTYPMENEAMRPLNRMGNLFFAKSLSWVLDSDLGDSLCGTKLLAAHDYRRVVAWRNDFGDFDPFGDFELLFPAAVLGLGIVDLPVRYRARTYGSTNISRFRHGAELLRMTGIGLTRIKTGGWP